jgi:hypothetical protein
MDTKVTNTRLNLNMKKIQRRKSRRRILDCKKIKRSWPE